MPGRIQNIFINDFLTVTDLPAFDVDGEITGYTYLPADARVVKEYQNAGVGILNADRNVAFWKNLGKAVNLSKCARCHGCAAYAAKILFDKGWHTTNGFNMWVCGRGDHYFLVLTNQALVAGSTGNTAAIFHAMDIIVDLWLYNVTRQTTGRKQLDTMACLVPDFAFITNADDIRVFVQYQ